MIAHVAAAGEGRGRVVLHLAPSGRMSEAAIDAALHLAQAFQSEIETLFVEDGQLLALAQFPFAREIALTGRSSRCLSPEDVETDLGHLAAVLHRRVSELAKRQEICCTSRLSRGEPVAALAAACAEPGPWNAVVLSALPDELGPDLVQRLFAQVEGTTGIVIAGGAADAKAPAPLVGEGWGGGEPQSRASGIPPTPNPSPQGGGGKSADARGAPRGGGRSARSSAVAQSKVFAGPIVALVEEIDDMAALLRSASRLAIPPSAGVRIVLAATTQDQVAWMDGQARLALGDEAGDLIGSVVTEADGISAAVQGLNALSPSLVIARFSRELGSSLATLPDALAGLRSPLLLLR